MAPSVSHKIANSYSQKYLRICLCAAAVAPIPKTASHKIWRGTPRPHCRHRPQTRFRIAGQSHPPPPPEIPQQIATPSRVTHSTGAPVAPSNSNAIPCATCHKSVAKLMPLANYLPTVGTCIVFRSPLIVLKLEILESKVALNPHP